MVVMVKEYLVVMLEEYVVMFREYIVVILEKYFVVMLVEYMVVMGKEYLIVMLREYIVLCSGIFGVLENAAVIMKLSWRNSPTFSFRSYKIIVIYNIISKMIMTAIEVIYHHMIHDALC